MQLGRFHRLGGRRFGKVRLLLEHGSTLKSMALLGPAAFGPRCELCGMPQTRYMLARHREAAEAVTGKRIEDLQFICRCPLPAPEGSGRWGPWVVVAASELENGWRSSELSPLRYRVSTHGHVELAGWAVGGVPETRIFRLPEGARPNEGDPVTERRKIRDEMLPRVLTDGSVIAGLPLPSS